MRAIGLIVPSLLILGACGDPLAKFERVSDETFATDAVVATALPTEAELERKESILSGLFRKRAEPEQVIIPEAEISKENATEVVDVNEVDAAAGGPLLDVEGSASDVVVDLSNDEAPTQEGDLIAQDTLALDQEETVETQAEVATVVAVASEPAAPRKGVLGWLRRDPENAEPVVIEEPATTENAVIDVVEAVDVPGAKSDEPAPEERIAALAPETDEAAVRTDAEPDKRRSLFGRDAPERQAGMALRDVGLGADLPFGDVARVCGVALNDLGKRVERAEARKTTYTLYDSAPDSATPRSFYVTGFSDGCARQFTASLAVFGTPTFHEQLRYGLPADEYPYSTTDRAYEKVKAKFCNVGRNTPCGARISKLEDTTAFVSVYEHFGENARWADMLLHDGALLATALKTP